MKKKKLIIIVLILIIIGSLIWGFLYINSSSQIDPNEKDYNGSINPPKGFNSTQTLIPGFGDINIPYNYKGKGMELINPKDNNVYFKYELVLEETNKVIDQTKLIEPGKAVEVFPWKGISPGNYNLTVKIQTYSLKDSKKQLNGANLKIKMNILK